MKQIKSSKIWRISSYFAAMLSAVFLSSPAMATLGQPVAGALGLQAGASPMKHKMEFFHNDLLLPIITAITIFVLGLLIYVMIRFNAKANPVPSKTTHNTMLEVVWTLIPVLILVVIAIPSMKMLYFVDKTHDAEMTIKAVGHQWYWTYEYPDHGGIELTANMVADKDLKPGQPRLLATDNAVVLPIDTNIRVLTTASDVLHSWAMPSLGVKMDAVPGRLNETWVRIDTEGTFYGQCSEICGTGHGFMPIEIKGVSKEAFAAWVVKQGGKMPVKGEAQATPVSAAPAAPAKTAANKDKKTGDKQ